MEADLIDVGRQRRAVGMLAALRALPEIVTRLLHGESLPSTPDSLRLRDSAKVPPAQGGWVLLDERPNDEIVLGTHSDERSAAPLASPRTRAYDTQRRRDAEANTV